MPGSTIAVGRASHALALVCCGLGVLAADCNSKKCASTADCREEEVCVQGLCRDVCRSHADCPSTERCVYGACQETGDAGVVATDAGTDDSATGDLLHADRRPQDTMQPDRGSRDAADADGPAPVCTAGERRCSVADDVQECNASGSDWELLDQCHPSLETCFEGACICKPHHHQGCHLGDVYWYNGCDEAEDLTLDCEALVCDNARCVAEVVCTAQELRCSSAGNVERCVAGTAWELQELCNEQEGRTCLGNQCACIPEQYLGCHDDDQYWFNGCGEPGELFEDCQDGLEECLDGSCQCISHHHQACHQGDVVWFDACGVPEEIAEDCPGTCVDPLGCVLCVPGELRCSVDGSAIEMCDATGQNWENRSCTEGVCNPETVECGCGPAQRDCGGGCVECPQGAGVTGIGCVQELCQVTACSSGFPCGSACCAPSLDEVQLSQGWPVGGSCSIVMDPDERPVISYYDNDNYQVVLASGGAGSWGLEDVTGAASVASTDIALLPGGRYAIGWTTTTTSDLVINTGPDSAPPRWPSSLIAPIFATSNVALAVADGRIHAAFHDDSGIVYVEVDGENPSLVTVSEFSDTMGSAVAIALDRNGLPGIAYSSREVDEYVVRLVKKDGEEFTHHLVESGQMLPPRSMALAFDDGNRPHLAYAPWNGSEDYPRYAHDPDGQGVFVVQEIGSLQTTSVRLAMVDGREPRVVFNVVVPGDPAGENGLWYAYPQGGGLSSWESFRIDVVNEVPSAFDYAIDKLGQWHISLQLDDSMYYLGVP